MSFIDTSDEKQDKDLEKLLKTSAIATSAGLYE